MDNVTPRLDDFSLAEMTTLYRLGKLVRASLELDTTLAAIADAACDLTSAEMSAILLLDADELLVLRLGRGAAVIAGGVKVPMSSGIAGRALSELKTVLVADMHAESQRARPDLDARSGVRAYIAAPLVWDGLRLGVVTVASTEPGALGAADAALVEELAAQAAAAVAHAHAFAQEQDRRAATDVVNRQLAERTAQLEQMQRHLLQSEKLTAIGQLANGIAHEMNTPLGIIMSNLSVLKEYGLAIADFSGVAQDAAKRLQRLEAPGTVAAALQSAAQAANLTYILEDLPQLTDESTASADRIATIVRSVATFAQQGVETMVPIRVEEALETAITLSWNELKQHGELVRRLTSVPSVYGQMSELAQVFVHLLINAAQSLPNRQGVVTVTTEADDHEVSIIIGDNGCGIPREHLTRAFDPFFSTREPGMGTGMGLSVCHGIISTFGGTIALESEVGQGTRVTVRLPIATSRMLEAA
jgi:signal transduction histidine kinase